MSGTILRGIGIGLLAVTQLQAASQQPASSTPSSNASAQHSFVSRYCVTCHNERLKTADLVLEGMDVANVGARPEVWEKVVRKVRAGQMPPAGAPRPDRPTYDSFSTYLETELDRAAAAKPNPGRPAIHRLNRSEYANVIRDLLAVDTEALDIRSLLPVDDSGYGFDNIGDVLSVSPLLMEGYMTAARKISKLAVGEPAMRPVFEAYDMPRYILQYDRMSEDLPFGSRGGIAVRHYFPADGEYVFKIRLQRNADYNIVGMDEPRRLDVRLDGERIGQFKVGGQSDGQPDAGDVELPRFGGAESKEDADIELRAPVKAGMRTLGVMFENVMAEPEGVYQPLVSDYSYAADYGNADTEPAIGNVTIGGPYDMQGLGDTPSRRRVFVCSPADSKDEEPCARKILSALARRAFRRPVRAQDVETLLGFYHAGRRDGDFEEGIQAALQRVLVDPEFLFRIERDPARVPPGTPYAVNDLELASRLSFFLWSSIPDDELLDVAERGRLRDAAVLEQQVRRMLADDRARALVDNFAGQWLYLRNVQAVWPNPDVFPEFAANLREDFQQETELFFESMLREDRGVMDLLDADYTFLNERLARHYGISNVYGSHFRRVAVSDENRKGLLGQSSILAVTSHATRTSPVMRGKWVLEQLLGTPPPPPPPDVPSLEEKKGEDGKPLTMRQQMERHRANPACASCHRLMDPLGFALENFDATGKWRTIEGSTPIDASGLLPDGTRFQGPAELRRLLLGRPEQIAKTITEKLLTYALGRGVEYYDAPAIRGILREAASGGYRWSSLVLGIVKSAPFQMRRSSES
jgi:mono/diheme cytochrome c family protein